MLAGQVGQAQSAEVQSDIEVSGYMSRGIGFLVPVICSSLLWGCALLHPGVPVIPAGPADPLTSFQLASVMSPAPVASTSPTPHAMPVGVTPAHALPRAVNPRTAVIVSVDIPDHTEISAELLRRSPDNVTVYTLTGSPGDAAGLAAELADFDPDRIVAIGLTAAIAARAVAATPTVFCQVYNYQDHDLVSANSKGVSMLPPVDLQLREWTRLTPGLRRIAVITGPGHDALIGEMEQAAERFGVTLSVRLANSDREALFAFREVAPEVDGLWLLPDNRILSPEVIGEIFAYSAEHGKQIATFGRSLLATGALLSSSGDPSDVVDRVLDRFASMDDHGSLQGPDMLRLTAVRTEINGPVATRLGLAKGEVAP